MDILNNSFKYSSKGNKNTVKCDLVSKNLSVFKAYSLRDDDKYFENRLKVFIKQSLLGMILITLYNHYFFAEQAHYRAWDALSILKMNFFTFFKNNKSLFKHILNTTYLKPYGVTFDIKTKGAGRFVFKGAKIGLKF